MGSHHVTNLGTTLLAKLEPNVLEDLDNFTRHDECLENTNV